MPPRKTVKARKQKRGLPTWAIIAGAAVVVLVVLGVAIVGLGGSQSPTPVPTSLSSSGIPQAGRTLGDQNAPISLVDYSDFQ